MNISISKLNKCDITGSGSKKYWLIYIMVIIFVNINNNDVQRELLARPRKF
jgi:hypothetical protein